MAPGNQFVINAVNYSQNFFAVKSYDTLIKNNGRILSQEDEDLALAGWKFTQPDYLAYGNNPVTAGRFGGLLNHIGTIQPNENGYYDEPVSNSQWVC